jgi:hypothetical protein
MDCLFFMPKIAVTILLYCLLLLAGYLYLLAQKLPGKNLLSTTNSIQSTTVSPSAHFTKLRQKALVVRDYIIKGGYNSYTCFLIDMSLPSGSNRFFIYNLQKDSVLASGLVTHGRCNQYWLQGRRYSNGVGSGCTSTGRYKVGVAYQGRFGLAFKLHGLDSSNSNAYKRYVVLHAHECVPQKETVAEICQSDGCPTVSPAFLQQLKQYIHHSGKPVLLWIFE